MELRKNLGMDFDTCESNWLRGTESSVNLFAIHESVDNLCSRRGTVYPDKFLSLLQAVRVMDLTSLCGDDTYSNVRRLCHKATTPVPIAWLQQFGIPNLKDLHCEAVCVYPSKVAVCVEELERKKSDVVVAAVAGGFPSGQYDLSTKIDEIKSCIESGAKEIDIVISREYVLCGDWKKLYNEVKFMRQAAENATLKVIISTGELATYSNIYRASLVCMAAGADFIKTSTGKEDVNATLGVGTVMVRAIRHYLNATGYMVGFKPAGGIRTSKDAFLWQNLMDKELHRRWLLPDLFRIGASSLLKELEQAIKEVITPLTDPDFTYDSEDL